MKKMITDKLSDYPVDEQIKLMYAQQDLKQYAEWQSRQKKTDRQYRLYTWIGLGALAVLFASMFFDNPEVPKIAGTVIVTLLAYAAGRDASS